MTVKTPLPKGSIDLVARLRGMVQGFLAPGQPVAATQAQAPEEEQAPRLRDYSPGQNTVTTPRSDEPRMAPFEQLRTLAANYDVASLCIQHLQQELAALDWSIAPTDADDREAPQRLAANIKRVKAALIRPDGDLLLDQWAAMLLGEDLEVGAPVVYLHKLKGGKLGPLEIVQGDTIKPLLDIRGRVAGFQQNWKGVPLSTFTTEQMLYMPRSRRRSSAYGVAPVERVLMAVNMALRRQNFDLSYFTEGNIPEAMVSAPEGWSLDDVKALQAWFDGVMVGNDAARRRMYVVPTDASKVHQFRHPVENTEPLLWLLKLTCAAFNVKPEEMGFTNGIIRATADQQGESQQRVGVTPVAHWIMDILSFIIQNHMGEPELGFFYDLGGKVDNRYTQAQTDEINIRSGIYSPQFVRNRDGISLGKGDPLLAQAAAGEEAAPTDDEPVIVEGGAADEAAADEAPVEDTTGAEGSNVLTLALAAGELEKEGATTGRKTGPGSRGGKYWIDAKGHVRYGPKPASEGIKESKAKAAEQKRAARAQATAQRKAEAERKKAERQKAKEERHRLAVGKANARDELKGTNDLSDMRDKGWATDKDDGYGADKNAANDAARQAGLKDKDSVYAVVKVNGEYYVVSKPLKDLQQERTQNTVSGGSHKTKEEDAKRDLEGGNSGNSGSGGGGRGALAQAAAGEDLRKWQSKAISRVRGGRPARCSFESEVIDEAAAAVIRSELGKATTVAEVRKVFAPYITYGQQNG